MDNQISEIRKTIRALRVSMLEAENVMRDQIRRDEECSEVSGQILVMRAEMARLVRKRATLGVCIRRRPPDCRMRANTPSSIMALRDGQAAC
jgi:hypothetical protein